MNYYWINKMTDFVQNAMPDLLLKHKYIWSILTFLFIKNYKSPVHVSKLCLMEERFTVRVKLLKLVLSFVLFNFFLLLFIFGKRQVNFGVLLIALLLIVLGYINYNGQRKKLKFVLSRIGK